MQGSAVSCFAFAAMVSFSAMVPRESHANEQRMDASDCFQWSPCPTCANEGYNGVTEFNGLRNASNGYVRLACAVPDRWDFLPETFATIDVDGYCNSSSEGCWFYAHTTFYGSNTGGRYSSFQGGSAPGNYLYNFGGFYNSGDRGDFKAIDVFLPELDANQSGATLRGFRFST